jgi:ElaB/YqjD/DUF883 family membrane-anchored ribosome-binding protein
MSRLAVDINSTRADMRSLFQFDNRRGSIESRIEMLRDEISELSRDAAHLSRGAYKSARDSGQDFFAEVPNYARAAMPVARRNARVAEKAVRDHPTAAVAVAGLVVLGLAATLIYSRR